GLTDTTRRYVHFWRWHTSTEAGIRRRHPWVPLRRSVRVVAGASGALSRFLRAWAVARLMVLPALIAAARQQRAERHCGCPLRRPPLELPLHPWPAPSSHHRRRLAAALLPQRGQEFDAVQ